MHQNFFNPDFYRLPLDLPIDDQLAKIRAILPSFVGVGRPLNLCVQLLNRWGMHLPGFSTELRFEILGGSGEIVEKIVVTPDDGSHFNFPVVFHEHDRTYRIRVADREKGIEAISNPSVCQENLYGFEHKLFWGDIHAHRIEAPETKYRDEKLWHRGPATVSEFYRYARDVACLDFAALTDHDYGLTANDWREIQEGAVYYNQPGRFVTFLGFEWAWNEGPSADYGHRNILYYYDDMPLISASWHGSNTPGNLFKTLERLSKNGRDILSIPHHPARLAHRIWHDWETMDPHFERLIEIYSLWGSAEKEGEPYPIKSRDSLEQAYDYEATGHFIQDGLAMGKKFGFTGGSESHDGRAGQPVVHGSIYRKEVAFLHQPGLLGVWSRRKTRDCLWGSLWQRRTVATTGVRIIAKLNIDDQPEGEIIRVTRPPKKLFVEVHGTGEIEHIVIVRNNKDWNLIDNPAQDCRFAIEDLPYPDNGCDWYYLRVRQKDGQMAWTSPIWVEDTN